MNHLPERIVFLIDLSDETAGQHHDTWQADLNVIRESILGFVDAKLSMSPKHTFALCALTDSAIWLLGPGEFTSDPLRLSQALTNVLPQGEIVQFDLTTLCQTLKANAYPNSDTITRALLIYNRSNVVPHISDASTWNELRAHPNFVLDALYIHVKPGEGVNPQVVFDFLVSLDTKGDDPNATQFFYEVLRSSQRKYFKFMTMLLAHSKQRCDQFSFETNLEPPPPAQEVAQSVAVPQPVAQSSAAGAQL